MDAVRFAESLEEAIKFYSTHRAHSFDGQDIDNISTFDNVLEVDMGDGTKFRVTVDKI